jgi:hypothetical protein
MGKKTKGEKGTVLNKKMSGGDKIVMKMIILITKEEKIGGKKEIEGKGIGKLDFFVV